MTRTGTTALEETARKRALIADEVASAPSPEALTQPMVAHTRRLIRRALDLLDAYRIATRNLLDANLMARLSSLAVENEQLVAELSVYLERFGASPPSQGVLRRLVAIGRVWFGQFAGATGAFRALISNEESLAEACRQLLSRTDVPPLLGQRVAAALRDSNARQEILAELSDEAAGE